MKLVRYGAKGAEKPAMLDAAGVLRDLSAHLGDITGDVLGDDTLAKLRTLDPASLPVVAGDPRIGACVGNFGKFLCIGLNYSDHAAEAGMDLPAHPILFLKEVTVDVPVQRSYAETEESKGSDDPSKNTTKTKVMKVSSLQCDTPCYEFSMRITQ